MCNPFRTSGLLHYSKPFTPRSRAVSQIFHGRVKPACVSADHRRAAPCRAASHRQSRKLTPLTAISRRDHEEVTLRAPLSSFIPCPPKPWRRRIHPFPMRRAWSLPRLCGLPRIPFGVGAGCAVKCQELIPLTPLTPLRCDAWLMVFAP